MLKFMCKNKKFLIVICAFFYFLSPIAIAVDEEKIDTTKNYLIVQVGAATDVDYNILYDSKGRNIYYVKDDNRIFNMIFKFNGFAGDSLGAYNRYVLYTDDDAIEGDTLIVNDYALKILYPVKREFGYGASILSKRFILRFENFM